MSDVRMLLIDELHGINIPVKFYKEFDFVQWGLNKDDYAGIASNDMPEYWDAWQELLTTAQHTDKDGVVWRLYQDGDVWAERADFIGWTEFDEGELESEFDEAFDELMGPVVLGTLSYPASKVLKEIDRTNYHQEFLAYLDARDDVKELNGNYYKEGN